MALETECLEAASELSELILLDLLFRVPLGVFSCPADRIQALGVGWPWETGTGCMQEACWLLRDNLLGTAACTKRLCLTNMMSQRD